MNINELNNLLNANQNVIIAGDFNATHHAWNNTKNNRCGIRLNSFIKRKNIKIIAPSTPTRYDHTDTANILDFALFKNIPYTTPTAVLNELNSDYLPVLIDIELNRPPHTAPQHFKTNWHDYNFHLQNTNLNTFNIDTKEKADMAIKNFTTAMINTFNKASTQNRLNFNIKLPPEIKSKIKHRNLTRRTWQSTKDPTLKSQLKKLNNEIKSLIQKHKNSKWEQYTDSLSENNTKYWKKLNPCTQQTTIPPLKRTPTA
ncbi:RNA-directed DNA polymerase from mobile element jockey [Caerostris extrusa]|uniref:RNA-directed DNA polymerase from mobile element jockey n=1 Tax=Caerostris extrusa TaxID=172846 RepID=A0AAV4YDE6_CAEEX|nr:RNA-directed DNA polymerase from mobile element jockey [Caerostris extrusa]